MYLKRSFQRSKAVRQQRKKRRAQNFPKLHETLECRRMLASAAMPLVDAITDGLPQPEDVCFVDPVNIVDDIEAVSGGPRPAGDSAQSRSSAINITVVDAFLIDGNFNRISSPVIGERVAVQVNWDTTNIPIGSSYRMGFYIDGVELLGGFTSVGAGNSTIR